MSPQDDQIQVIVDNTEFSICAWLDEQAKRHEDHFLEHGYESSSDRAHHYRDAANGIRTGEWRK